MNLSNVADVIEPHRSVKRFEMCCLVTGADDLFCAMVKCELRVNQIYSMRFDEYSNKIYSKINPFIHQCNHSSSWQTFCKLLINQHILIAHRIIRCIPTKGSADIATLLITLAINFIKRIYPFISINLMQQTGELAKYKRAPIKPTTIAPLFGLVWCKHSILWNLFLCCAMGKCVN